MVEGRGGRSRIGEKDGDGMAGGRGSYGFPGARLKAVLASVVGSRSLSGFHRALWKQAEEPPLGWPHLSQSSFYQGG